MNILVTGGSGFIGTHLRKKLIAHGHTVVNVDIRNPEDGEAYLYADVAQRVTPLYNAFKKHRFDVVYHFAARTSVPFSVKFPTEDARVNVLGTLNLLELCKEFGAKLIFAGTAASYGVATSLPVDESAPLAPQSPYGVSKTAAEAYIRQSDVRYTICRFANVYGIGGQGLIPKYVNHAVRELPGMLFGDGTQTRDYIYVKDLTAALIKCIDHGDGETLNLSTSEPHSVNDVIDAVRERFPQFDIKMEPVPRPGDLPESQLSNERAKRVLGWEPVYTLQTGITDMLLGLRQQMVLERE